MKTLAVVMLVVVMGAGQLQGAVMVTSNATRPSENVLLGHTVPITNFGYSMRWISDTGDPDYGHMDIGQSFLVPAGIDFVVDKITVRKRDYGSSVTGQDFFVEFWTVSDWYDWSGNNLVNSQSDTFPNSGLGSSFWTFDIEDVMLPGDQYYAFVLGFSEGPSTGRSVTYVGDYMGGFSPGKMITRTGTPATWMSGFGGRDLDFALQGTVIPEPTTFVIWSLLGALTIGWWRRRRAA